MEIKPGQQWRYDNRIFTIGSVRVKYCTLLNARGDVRNPAYPISGFSRGDGGGWSLVQDVEDTHYKAKCPECKRVKKIVKDDYLCARCREAQR